MLSEEVCPRSPLASALIVKNTFIDMEDENSDCEPHRRSSSEPPSCRHRHFGDGPLGFHGMRSKFAGDDNSSTSSGSPRGTSGGGSDFASEERSSQQGSTESASPSAGLNPNAPVWSPSWSPPSSPPLCMPAFSMMDAAPPNPTVFYQMPLSSPGPGQALPVLPQQQAYGDQRPPPPPPLAGSQPPPPPVDGTGSHGYQPTSARHRLNANAKAWQPGGTGAPTTVPTTMPNNGNVVLAVPPPPPAPSQDVLASVPNGFRTQFEAVLDATKQALKSNKTVLGVDIFESTGTWDRGMSVVVWQREDKGGKDRDQILKLAKDALLQGAANSECVYVMGYKNRHYGFTSSEFGFTTVLGGMFDESKACWDLFRTGHCRREWDCRWQHPACKLPINVEIRRARS